MEQQLAESQWTPSEATQQLSCLHHTVVEKERDINRLESQVDEQRKMRLNDAKQVEAKAAKIKEWVTNKLREVRPFFQKLQTDGWLSCGSEFPVNELRLIACHLGDALHVECFTQSGPELIKVGAHLVIVCKVVAVNE